VTARFRLFVAGETARSLRAAAHIRSLCAQALDDDYELEIIDVLERPDLADEARILATPTVIKASPPPLRRVIGDLSDLERLASALDLELPEPLTRGDRS
jgi:circadian clock protein KaiB